MVTFRAAFCFTMFALLVTENTFNVYRQTIDLELLLFGKVKICQIDKMRFSHRHQNTAEAHFHEFQLHFLEILVIEKSIVLNFGISSLTLR